MPPKGSRQAPRAGKARAVEIEDDTTATAAAAAAAAESGTKNEADTIKTELGDSSYSPYDVDMSPAAAAAGVASETVGRDNYDDQNDDTEKGDNSIDVEDDPVIKSYDVVINNNLDQLLHLFQYPNRLKDKPYSAHEGTGPLGARWKEKSGLVELDVPVNTRTNYDRDKGIQWGKVMRAAKVKGMTSASAPSGNYAASNASSDGPGKKRRLAGGNSPWGGSEQDGEDILMRDADLDWNTARARGMVLDKQTLGAKIQPGSTNYFVGKWDKDCLHLSRLHDVVQLRPQFSHLDKTVEQERATLKALKDSNHPTTTKSQEARAVNLTVKASAEGRFGEIRVPSNSDSIWNDIRKEEDEQWREVSWVDQDANDAWALYQQMSDGMPTKLVPTTSKEIYLHSCSAGTGDADYP